MAPVVDCHAHIRNPEKGEPELVLEAADRAGVDKVILCSLGREWAAFPDAAALEQANADIAEVVEKYPDRFMGMVYLSADEVALAIAAYRDRFVFSAVLRPDFTGWEDDLGRCVAEYGAKCVLLYSQYHRYDLMGEATDELVAAAGDAGLVVCVQCWLEDPRRQFNREMIQPVAPAAMKGFVEAHPGVPMAALGLRFGEPDIIGGPLPENFYFETSHYENMRDLELAMERFPMERVLFGTNFPLYNYVANVEKLARGKISDAQRLAIGSGNAKRLLGIA